MGNIEVSTNGEGSCAECGKPGTVEFAVGGMWTDLVLCLDCANELGQKLVLVELRGERRD